MTSVPRPPLPPLKKVPEYRPEAGTVFLLEKWNEEQLGYQVVGSLPYDQKQFWYLLGVIDSSSGRRRQVYRLTPIESALELVEWPVFFKWRETDRRHAAIYREAADIVSDPDRYVSHPGGYARTKDNRHCLGTDKEAVRFNLFGALDHATNIVYERTGRQYPYPNYHPALDFSRWLNDQHLIEWAYVSADTQNPDKHRPAAEIASELRDFANFLDKQLARYDSLQHP